MLINRMISREMVLVLEVSAVTVRFCVGVGTTPVMHQDSQELLHMQVMYSWGDCVHMVFMHIIEHNYYILYRKSYLQIGSMFITR